MNKKIKLEMIADEKLIDNLAGYIAEDIADGDDYYDEVTDLYNETRNSLFDNINPESGLNDELDAMLDNARDQVYEESYEILIDEVKEFTNNWIDHYQKDIYGLLSNRITQAYPEYSDKISSEDHSIIIKDCDLTEDDLNSCIDDAYDDWIDKLDKEIETDDHKKLDLYSYNNISYDEDMIFEKLSEYLEYSVIMQDLKD